VNQLIGQNSKIFLVGEMGLAAVSALLEKQVCKVDHNELNYQEYARFFKMLFEKAKASGCELVLPVDFITALKIKREQVLAHASGQGTEDRPTSRSQEENSGSNTKPKPGQKAVEKPAEAAPEEKKEIVPTEEAKIWMESPQMHWTDVSLKAGTANTVDLEDQIQQKLSGDGKKPSGHSSIATPAPKTPDADAETNSRAGTADKVVTVAPGDFLLQYGPKTIAQLE
jgi:hypothetical protein